MKLFEDSFGTVIVDALETLQLELLTFRITATWWKLYKHIIFNILQKCISPQTSPNLSLRFIAMFDILPLPHLDFARPWSFKVWKVHASLQGHENCHTILKNIGAWKLPHVTFLARISRNYYWGWLRSKSFF